MKICLFNQDLGYGGAEKMMAWLANSLAADSSFFVTFLTFRDNDKDYQQLDDAVTRLRISSEKKGGNVLDIVRTAVSLRKFLCRERPDAVIAFLSPAQLRLRMAAVGTGTKVIFSHRSDPYYRNFNGFKAEIAGFLSDLVFRSADSFVFQTKRSMDYFPPDIRRRAVVIPNPVKPLNCQSSRIPGGDSPRVVTVSRLDIKQKRQDLLIEAFNIFNRSHPEYELCLYGSGPDLELIRSMASANPKIILCGVTEDVPASISTASMFVLVSDFEGIPNALLEAMSIGLPCISTDFSSGGASLLIDSPDCGRLVPCGDVDAIAGAMSFYADNIGEAERIGRNAKAVNERFSEKMIFELWRKFIVSVVIAC